MSPSKPTRGALRVVAGSARGRRFDAPPGDSTRPTSDRVRQALFNALESMGALDGATVIDAFAGSGALGIEALSRGAGQVTFAETDAAAAGVVRANVAALHMAHRAKVVSRPAERLLRDARRVDLVLLDPPYAYDQWPKLLDAAASAVVRGGVIVLESDREIPLPGSLEAVRVKTYGSTVVQFAIRSGAPS